MGFAELAVDKIGRFDVRSIGKAAAPAWERASDESSGQRSNG